MGPPRVFDGHDTVAVLQRDLDGVGQPFAHPFTHHQPVHHQFRPDGSEVSPVSSASSATSPSSLTRTNPARIIRSVSRRNSS